jgi:pre-mRNA-splicing factor CDC5/CEF1
MVFLINNPAEIAREKAEKKDMINSLLSTLDGKRRMEIEDSERKRDFKRQKSTKENEDFVPPAALKASTELAMSDRKRLVLPAPQVSESELEELVCSLFIYTR